MGLTLKSGWISEANKRLSPNFDDRPPGVTVDLLIIHGISLPPGEFGGDWIERFFSGQLDFDAHPYFDEIRDLKVSAHFLIKRSGELVQFVSTDKRAWHAGESNFCGRPACNDYSIGVELEGVDDIEYTAQQYGSLENLLVTLFETYPELSPERVVGHCDVAPGRKTDPGPGFDFERLKTALANRRTGNIDQRKPTEETES